MPPGVVEQAERREEVNLRFYVKRKVAGEVRRAVVFVRELVPRFLIAAVARCLYNEPYRSVPMTHEIDLDRQEGGRVAYGWRAEGRRFAMSARARGPASDLEPGSEAEFITEHYWGYTRQRDGGTLEYRVDHPPWVTWPAQDIRLEGPFDALYGSDFGAVLSVAPRSGFIALGSEVKVYPGVPLDERGGSG